MEGAMDGEVRNERMLLKIAALLVSLSLVAERAAGRAFPVRLLVLSILWPAEAIARAFVARETPTELDFLGDVAGSAGGHPADAAALALRLRMLAAILCDLVGTALCSAAGNAGAGDVAPCTVAPFPILLLFFPVARRPRPHDTS